MKTPTTRAGVARTTILAIGVVAGLLVGGAFAFAAPWDRGAQHHGGAAFAAEPTAAPSLDPGEPVQAPGAATLTEGNVVADASVGDLRSEVELGRDHTKDGAVAAFTSYSVWLVGSPAAAQHPQDAAETLGAELLNPADAQLVAGMQRRAGDEFAAERGAYRVIAFSGDDRAPEQVMLEVAAPLTLAGKTRWAVVGGVVKWNKGAWVLVSISPREIPQADADDATDLTRSERMRTLDGLGWKTFADEDGQTR